ncbi:long-chain fatty acid transporter [Vibrio sp. S9_S30]|uniref:outer membrane protein transport protein n=1 Tax=Vibrio sp. S9_S30 TaxID=2720226 RepID=UPI001681619A|nr:outer membrane protein transport protein [Vibrio sp. S9_S30]MBD1557534.1 long-chain fatty acid transporter [Vibrio sp. S9_S30]
MLKANPLRSTPLKASLIIVAVLGSGGAHAAGYQIAFDSVSGLGRAYAGDAAIGDNATAMGRNPATMALFEQAQFSGSLIYFDAAIDVVGSSSAQSSSDIVPSQMIPASYYVRPINDQWAFGIGLYSNYGLGTDLKDTFQSGDVAGDTSIKSVNLNPAISYRVNDMFSVGAGISYIYAMGKATRFLGGGAPSFDKQSTDKLLSWEGDGGTFGWNIGALIELDESTRFGLSYRASSTPKLKGDFTDYKPLVVAIPGGGTAPSTAAVPLPATFEFSGYHDLNTAFAIHYSALWTNWSEYTEFKATGNKCTVDSGTCFLKRENYNDSWRWAIGATYQLDPSMTLRAGLALDEKAGDTTLSIPDQTAIWYTAGMAYQYSEDWSFDFGLAYMDRSREQFTESSFFASNHNYEVKGNLVIVGIQANYTF